MCLDSSANTFCCLLKEFIKQAVPSEQSYESWALGLSVCESINEIQSGKAVVSLKVGSRDFRTLRSTLTSIPDTMLHAMFAEHLFGNDTTEDEVAVIDSRDGDIFANYILPFLRGDDTFKASFQKLLKLTSRIMHRDRVVVYEELTFFALTELFDNIQAKRGPSAYFGFDCADRVGNCKHYKLRVVSAWGPAKDAGMVTNDWILAVEGLRVTTLDEFKAILSVLEPNIPVTYTIERHSRIQQIPITPATTDKKPGAMRYRVTRSTFAIPAPPSGKKAKNPPKKLHP